MHDLAILADDLTGAVDSAAAFASQDMPVEVVWSGPAAGARTAMDSETRDADPAVARAQVEAWMATLGETILAMKKVDSLLRGNSVAEIAACCASRQFELVIVAPAFPAQRRTTRGGQQYAAEGRVERPAGPPLPAALQAAGLDPRLVETGAPLPNRGIAVCDAENEDDLVRIGRAAGSIDGRILWCGSAGLARALAGTASPRPPVPRPGLAIIGSRHAMSAGHGRWLADALGERCIVITGAAFEAGIARLKSGAEAAIAQALLFDLPPMPEHEAAAIYRDVFGALGKALPRPQALIAVGGDTLHRLVTSLAARSLSTIGEWAAGVAISRIVGGPWAGTIIYSKSGAFDDAGLFAELTKGDTQSA